MHKGDRIKCSGLANMLITSLELQNNGIKTKYDFNVKKNEFYLVVTEVQDEDDYDWSTIQNWVNKFVNMVGRKAGY